MCLNHSKCLLKSSNLSGFFAQIYPISLCQNNLSSNATLPQVAIWELFYFPSLLAHVFSANFSMYFSSSASFLGPTPFPCYLRSQITLASEQFTTLSSSKPDSSKRSFSMNKKSLKMPWYQGTWSWILFIQKKTSLSLWLF